MHPLELTSESLQKALDLTSRFVREEIDSLEEQPSADVEGAEELARTFAETLPTNPKPLEAILDRLRPAIRKSFNTAGPGYLAFIPGGGIMSAALADFIAASTNRYVGVRPPAPALSQIEETAIAWLAQIMGYPKTAGGILTSGGSLSTLSAIVAARETKLKDISKGTLYISAETHYCVPKAARIAGFRDWQVRRVAVDDRRRMDVKALAHAVEADRMKGLKPFLIIANVGTTNTGAIDEIPRLVSIGRSHSMWVHADAAYGGFFRLAGAGPGLMPEIEECDSITLDPHKGMFLPYGTGCLLVRDPENLKRAHSMDAEYLHDVRASDSPNFSDLSPELSRDFRGLRIWLPLVLHGVNAFRDAIEEKLMLTRWAYDRLREDSRFEILDEPQLSVVAFRLKGEGPTADARNEDLQRRVNARGRVFLSSTRLDGRYVIRLCVLSFRTHMDRVRDAVEAIRAEANAAEDVTPDR
ncbi:MAG: aminotransferase class V-fold PLP-dependent enzyme [Vicinamibacteria bacterium]|nr:aminotransferase class V-fold PLP-dependent enzyme [Vicinamibacteria bacterium]